jgi:hypothetical protein
MNMFHGYLKIWILQADKLECQMETIMLPCYMKIAIFFDLLTGRLYYILDKCILWQLFYILQY